MSLEHTLLDIVQKQEENILKIRSFLALIFFLIDPSRMYNTLSYLLPLSKTFSEKDIISDFSDLDTPFEFFSKKDIKIDLLQNIDWNEFFLISGGIVFSSCAEIRIVMNLFLPLKNNS